MRNTALKKENDVEGLPLGTEQIAGSVESVIFRSEKTDYTVVELLGEKGERIVAVGKMPYIAEGEEAILTGTWTRHAEYGRQFLVENYEKKLPTGAAAILKYLSSRTVKGVGAATAIKIVERYGDDTFDVIENHPDWLADIPGISRKRAKEIHESFREQAGIRSLMMFCRDVFGSTVITRIYKLWGNRSVDLIRENPYRLCHEVYGIGFERADSLAASLGIRPDSEERLLAGLSYLLHYNATANGHCCMPRDKLSEALSMQLSVSRELADEAILLGARRRIIVSEVYQETDYIYLRSFYESECFVAEKLRALDSGCPTLEHRDIDRLIERSELASGIAYAPMQRHALREALRSGVLLLTGGPGTGKTTIIKALLHIFDSLGMRVALAAPTGRAAKRMSEATSSEGKTVHRLLEIVRNEGVMPVFGRNRENPLSEDVVILDEASMIDLPLAESLLLAIKRGARLIFVGDADQLPSVGHGNVFGDLLSSGVLNTVRLDQIFRQSGESLIVTNAHRINAGEMPKLDVADNDFFFMPRREEEIGATLVDLLTRRLPRAYGDAVLEQLQVITPSRKGIAGTENLNLMLQEALNPAAPGRAEISFRDRVFREGDRVMQIRNNYNAEWIENPTSAEGVFNGDIGTIEKIGADGEYMAVRFDGQRIARYDRTMYEELEHAYAVTVHKSQGSEYGTVILPLYFCPPMLMTRNLLYTAVTRARQRAILLGRRDVIDRMVKNNRHFMRYTLLCERLSGKLDKRQGQ